MDRNALDEVFISSDAMHRNSVTTRLFNSLEIALDTAYDLSSRFCEYDVAKAFTMETKDFLGYLVKPEGLIFKNLL